MSKFVDRPFETKPADSKGIAVLKPVIFKGANNTAVQIALKTNEFISDEKRLAKIEVRVSKASFDDYRKHSGDLFGPGAPFNDSQYADQKACAEGTFFDDNPCLPPLPSEDCENPQLPFDLTDCKGNPPDLRGSGFVVTGTLENFPKDTVVRGLMLLLFK